MDKVLKFNVHIRGVAPLLFNRYPEEEDQTGQAGAKQKRAPLTKDEQVERSLYRDEKKQIYTPADHVIGSMIKAASSFKLEGKRTFIDVVKGGFFIEPLKIPHVNQKYTTDWRSVVIPKQRARVMKGRARLDEWGLKFKLICIDPRASVQDVKDIMNYAGAYKGIGDYRPRYGRFEVVSIEQVK